MPVYELELSPAARRDLKSLPVTIQERIVIEHLPIIRNNPFQTGRPLVGTLHKERSYHFGRKPEYRIVYCVEGKITTVTLLGSREGIYKKAMRRK